MDSRNPILKGTLLDAVPAWEFIHSPARNGWLVKVHGQYIVDAETGEPTLYRPPVAINTMKEFDAWAEQVKSSVGRMSGQPVNI